MTRDGHNTQGRLKQKALGFAAAVCWILGVWGLVVFLLLLSLHSKACLAGCQTIARIFFSSSLLLPGRVANNLPIKAALVSNLISAFFQDLCMLKSLGVSFWVFASAPHSPSFIAIPWTDKDELRAGMSDRCQQIPQHSIFFYKLSGSWSPSYYSWNEMYSPANAVFLLQWMECFWKIGTVLDDFASSFKYLIFPFLTFFIKQASVCLS